MEYQKNPNMSKAEARKIKRQRKDGKALAKKKAMADRVLKCSGCKNKAIIRGACNKCYAKYMHEIESGATTEASLIRRKKLLPGRSKTEKSIGKNRSNKLFNNRSKIKGKGKPGECRVPSCKNKQSRRGLCNTHRVYAKGLIKQGKATEQNLINRGLLLENKNYKNSKKSKKIKKRAHCSKKLLTSDKCLYPGCKVKRHGRGLCKRHYNQAMRELKKHTGDARKIRENDLIKRCLLLPKTASKPKKKESNAFKYKSKIRGSINRLF